MLTVTPVLGACKGTKPCTPATLRGLPPKAFIDLRARFGWLTVAFGLPDEPLLPAAGMHGHWARCAQGCGELCSHHVWPGV